MKLKMEIFCLRKSKTWLLSHHLKHRTKNLSFRILNLECWKIIFQKWWRHDKPLPIFKASDFCFVFRSLCNGSVIDLAQSANTNITYFYMAATHPALLSRNLIGWSSGRIAPSCLMNSGAKQSRYKARWPKLSQNSRKTSESYKTRENAFHKTYFSEYSRLVFGQFSGNLKINIKPWENDFGL